MENKERLTPDELAKLISQERFEDLCTLAQTLVRFNNTKSILNLISDIERSILSIDVEIRQLQKEMDVINPFLKTLECDSTLVSVSSYLELINSFNSRYDHPKGIYTKVINGNEIIIFNESEKAYLLCKRISVSTAQSKKFADYECTEVLDLRDVSENKEVYANFRILFKGPSGITNVKTIVFFHDENVKE